MLHTFIPPDMSTNPEKFVTPDGLARSIWILKEAIGGDLNRALENPDLKLTHAHWLGRELRYLLTWSWHGSKEDLASLDTIQNWLLNRDTESIVQALEFFSEKITEMGEMAYENLLRYERGEKQWDNWDNSLYQWTLLQESTLFATRIWLDKTIIDKWKSRLSEKDIKALNENIVPEAYVPMRITWYFNEL